MNTPVNVKIFDVGLEDWKGLFSYLVKERGDFYINIYSLVKYSSLIFLQEYAI